MGALFFVLPRLERLAGDAHPLRQRARQRQPGHRLAKAHEMEQQTLLTLAFANPTSK